MTERSPPGKDGVDGFPQAFGKYLLVHPLGEGGMGAVYLAKVRGLAGIEKLCVVKTLRPALVADEDYVARFLDEARLVVQLAHRNICSVFDVGAIDGRYYLAMEHIAGRDARRLFARLAERGERLSEGAALHLMGEVLDALDYAHRLRDPRSEEPLRLVHRDVSPQNVMVNFEGEVKLIDFGLALSTMKGQRTEPQNVMGKIAYMAPEHARGDPLDGRADQFSAAIVLYEALTNTRYYGPLTPHQIWGVSGTGDHRPALLGALDEDIVSLLERALSPRAEHRFPSCAELREAVEAALLARGVKSGDARRELRDHMHKLFDEERKAERALLLRVGGDEATESLAQLGSGSSSAPADIESPAPTSRAGTRDQASVSSSAEASSGTVPTPPPSRPADDATAMYAQAAGLTARSRRARALGAGALVAAVLVVLALGVGFVMRGSVDGVASAEPTTSSAAEPASPAARDAGPAPDEGPPERAAASVAAPVTAAPAPATAPPPPAEDAPTPVEPRVDSKPRAQADSRRRQAGASKRPVRRPEPPTGYKAMLGYVKRWCAAEPCTSAVLAHDEDMRARGEPSTEDLLSAVKALRSCVERCAR